MTERRSRGAWRLLHSGRATDALDCSSAAASHKVTDSANHGMHV